MRVIQGELDNSIGNFIVCLIPMDIILIYLAFLRLYPAFLDQTSVSVDGVARDATDA